MSTKKKNVFSNCKLFLLFYKRNLERERDSPYKHRHRECNPYIPLWNIYRILCIYKKTTGLITVLKAQANIKKTM